VRAELARSPIVAAVERGVARSSSDDGRTFERVDHALTDSAL
jgi:hypothetical protein